MKPRESQIDEADQWKLRLFAASLAQSQSQSRGDGFPDPKHLVLFPTYACEHRCAGCLYEIPADRRHGEWSESVLETVVHLAHQLKPGHVEISGGGDPSCHPAFSRILQSLHPHTCSLGLITNAQSLTPAHIDTIARTCHHVRVSLDAIDGELYRALRGGAADLAQTLANLTALRDLRGQGRLRAVGAKCLVGKGNCDHVDAFLRWALDSGLDYVQFKPLRQHPSECEPAVLARLDEQITAARASHLSGTEIRGSLAPMPAGQGPCWASSLHAVIDPVGDVYLCCYYPGREESFRLGSLLHAPWRALWGSARHRQVMAASDMSRCGHDCRFKLYASVLAEDLRDGSKGRPELPSEPAPGREPGLDPR